MFMMTINRFRDFLLQGVGDPVGKRRGMRWRERIWLCPEEDLN